MKREIWKPTCIFPMQYYDFTYADYVKYSDIWHRGYQSWGTLILLKLVRVVAVVALTWANSVPWIHVHVTRDWEHAVWTLVFATCSLSRGVNFYPEVHCLCACARLFRPRILILIYDKRFARAMYVCMWVSSFLKQTETLLFCSKESVVNRRTCRYGLFPVTCRHIRNMSFIVPLSILTAVYKWGCGLCEQGRPQLTCWPPHEYACFAHRDWFILVRY